MCFNFYAKRVTLLFAGKKVYFDCHHGNIFSHVNIDKVLPIVSYYDFMKTTQDTWRKAVKLHGAPTDWNSLHAL